MQEIGRGDKSKIKGYNQCKFSYKNVPVKLERSTTINREVTECNDIPQRVCQSHWVVDNRGDKVWEEDPTTCKTFEVTKCQQVSEMLNSIMSKILT